MGKWQTGAAEIERLLESRHLERVPASRMQADRLIVQAGRHLDSARRVAPEDPEGGYALVYDAARKALTGVLANQGLRPTVAGGHIAVFEAVAAQAGRDGVAVLGPFDRMCRQRRASEYPRIDDPEPETEDVLADIPKVEAIVRAAGALIDAMPVW